MSSKIPFEALPLRKDGPRGNAWGRFGDDDQIGTLNLLTPENTSKAAREIIDGTRVATDWPLNRMLKPGFGREPFKQHIKPLLPGAANDDIITFNTQSSSQWDGLRHVSYLKEKIYYNGRMEADWAGTDVLGTQAWVESGGIVGRGVLLDYAAYADAKGIEIEAFTTNAITLSTLKDVAAWQGVTFKENDILFVRSGWVRAYEKLSEDECQAFADLKEPKLIGIEASKEMLEWLWDLSITAVAGDHPAMEEWPCPPEKLEFRLHEWLIAGWGMPIGELFDLEKLSRVCQEKGRWSFFFTSVPLHIPGGVASPPNGVAIF